MSTFGVIIARFQVPELHLGHTHLIREVLSRHNTVVVLLGVSSSAPTDINPLSFLVRKKMLQQHFPNLIIEPLYDNTSDEVWSSFIDDALKKYEGTPILYGSRKSFIPHYKGKHTCLEIQAIWERSGSEIREELLEPVHSSNFRAGIIHNIMTRFPIVYPTVDIACFKESSILLGRKKNELLWRFPGGFVDPSDTSMLIAAKRELSEEVGSIETTDWEYVDSLKMNDPRYRGSKDGIMTTLFKCKYMFGAVIASDDLQEAKWFPFNPDLKNIVMPVHHPLLNALGV